MSLDSISKFIQEWRGKRKVTGLATAKTTLNKADRAMAAIEVMAEALEKIGCNETFHRLGGIDDCDRCNALAKASTLLGEG